MDRRHIVLAVAVAASIATKYGSSEDYRFAGEDSQTLETMSLEKAETRRWVLTGEVELPPEAQGEAYGSMLSVHAYVTGPPGLQSVSLIVRDCATGEVVGQAVVADEPGGGSWTEGQADVPDYFGDCPIGEECVRRACLDVTNNATPLAEVDLDVDAWLRSEAFGEYETNFGVDLRLMVEEIEP